MVWRPYARFDDVVDWEMLQAQLAGNARVSLVCFDVVEWQHPERVVRQFGNLPVIPQAPVNMVLYRQPKEATFAGEDWLVRWFVEIGRWARFCSDLEGLVDCTTKIASQAEYMAWYSEITRLRVGKPEPVPHSRYQTRELYDGVEGYRVMVAALDMLKQLDSRAPVEFLEDLGKISDTFLTPFTRLMKKIKGPAYKPPTFENIKPLSLYEEANATTNTSQDVIEMTQPSQHVSQPPIPSGSASSTRPSKLPTRRMKGEKWSITKDLDVHKRNEIYADWGWGIGQKPNLKGGIEVCGHHISETAMQSLAPASWIDDRIIFCYMALLREREETIHRSNIWERKPIYYFMDPYFIVMGWDHMKKIKRAIRKGESQLNKAWHDALRSLHGFATSSIGPSVVEADYIFLPCCVSGVHWILFMVCTKTFDVILLDSMNDEVEYSKETEVVSWLLPRFLLKLKPQMERDPDSSHVVPLPQRPKQRNSNDCGVFVMKYMDFMLQGYDITSIASWSEHLVNMFRYRIAKELQAGKARGISSVRMRQRHQLVD